MLLTRRPHQLAARRDPKLLSQHLGFHYLPIDNVALNPLYQISVELVSAGDKLLERYPQGRTKVTLSRSGLKRILFVKTDPDQLNDILASTPQRCPIFDLIKRSRANARSTPSAG